MPDPSDLTRTVRTKITVDPSGCWLWTGSVNGSGYALIKMRGTAVLAHRYVWEHYHGPILDDLTLDHLCTGHRHCVNPEHMEPVTRSENSVRANHRRHHEGYRRNTQPTGDE